MTQFSGTNRWQNRKKNQHVKFDSYRAVTNSNLTFCFAAKVFDGVRMKLSQGSHFTRGRQFKIYFIIHERFSIRFGSTTSTLSNKIHEYQSGKPRLSVIRNQKCLTQCKIKMNIRAWLAANKFDWYFKIIPAPEFLRKERCQLGKQISDKEARFKRSKFVANGSNSC